MKRDEQLKLYIDIKEKLIGLDYFNKEEQATYRKLRHHLDMMIEHLGNLDLV